MSKSDISKILIQSKIKKLNSGSLPEFDWPPPNYNIIPESDKGWVGIAKAVLNLNTNYSKVIKDVELCK